MDSTGSTAVDNTAPGRARDHVGFDATGLSSLAINLAHSEACSGERLRHQAGLRIPRASLRAPVSRCAEDSDGRVGRGAPLAAALGGRALADASGTAPIELEAHAQLAYLCAGGGAGVSDNQVTANGCQVSGTPLSEWMPRSAKDMPEPRTRALTTLVTRT